MGVAACGVRGLFIVALEMGKELKRLRTHDDKWPTSYPLALRCQAAYHTCTHLTLGIRPWTVALALKHAKGYFNRPQAKKKTTSIGFKLKRTCHCQASRCWSRNHAQLEV